MQGIWRRLGFVALFAALAAPASAQQLQGAPVWPGVTLPTFVIPASAVNGGGTFTGQLFGPTSTCAAPAYAFTGQTTSGMAGTATPSVLMCVNGSTIVTYTATAATFAQPILGPNGINTAPSWSFSSEPSTGRFWSGAGLMDEAIASTHILRVDSTGYRFGAGLCLSWSSTSNPALTADTKICRSGAANTVSFGTGTPRLVIQAPTTSPTCSASCGTSSSVTGSDSAMIVTMGSSGVPASPFTVTFNGTWAATPSCTANASKTGMATGKKPLLVVASTTTVIITTDGTAPSTSDTYAIQCFGVQ